MFYATNNIAGIEHFIVTVEPTNKVSRVFHAAEHTLRSARFNRTKLVVNKVG